MVFTPYPSCCKIESRLWLLVDLLSSWFLLVG